MKGCAGYLEDLTLLLAGEIDPTRRTALLGHLEVCPECARERVVLERLVSDLRSAEVPDPGPVYWSGFESRFRARLASRRAATRRRALYAMAAAAAALAVVAGVGLVRERPAVDSPGGPGGGMAAALPNAGPGTTPGIGRRETGAAQVQASSAEGERAEALLEAALLAARSRASAAEEFEAILDEIAPGDPYALAGDADMEMDRGSGV